MYAIGNVTIFEVLFVLIAIWGLRVSIPNVWFARQRQRRLIEAGTNGVLRAIARMFVVLHGGIAVFMACAGIVALIAMLTPQRVNHWTWRGTTLQSLLAACEALIVWVSAYTGDVERYVARYAEVTNATEKSS